MMKRKAGHFDFLFGEKRGGKIARVTFIPATKVPMSNGVFAEDPPALDGVLPIRPLQNQQTNQQSEDATGFDQNYIPLDGEIRRARKGLLWQWAQTQDAFIAEVLRRQEGVEIPYQEMLAGVFGKKCGWREAMIIEARHDENCRNELGQWLSLCAMKGESKELDAFSQAVESVSRAEEVGPVNRKFVCGLMFVLRCEHETRCRPPQNKVREFLKKNGMPVDDSRKNEARDLFKGPIMGTLPKGKAGRPRCPRG